MTERVFLGQRASYVKFWAVWTAVQWGLAWLYGRWLLGKMSRQELETK